MKLQGSKLIIRNTGILYAKTFITMGISLYSTRLILNTLGANDFGIFSLIGGIVAMLTFLNNSMTQATQRFLTHSLGHGNKEKLRQIFNTSVLLHFIIGFFVVAIIELFGLWAFDSMLTIPIERIAIAKIIFHCIVISTFFTIISVPYDAIINAHEHMLFDSILGILQSLGVLTIAILIGYVHSDKLLLYGTLMAALSFLLLIVRRVYCRVTYTVTKIHFKKYLKKTTIKEMLSFASWSFFSATTSLIGGYGVGVLLNSFFGARLNAAQGIATQINGQISVFAVSMMKALSPQITKSEGAGERQRMIKLAMKGSKFSFFLLTFFAMPVLIEAPYILKLWLVNPPAYTFVFCRLVLIVALLSQISLPINSMVNAVGDIKMLSVFSSILFVMVIPITYLLFKLKYPPFWVYIVQIFSELGLLALRLYFAKKTVKLSLKEFRNSVINPVLTLFFPLALIAIFPSIFLDESFFRLALTIVSCTLTFILLMRYFVLDSEEKTMFKGYYIKLKTKLIIQKV